MHSFVCGIALSEWSKGYIKHAKRHNNDIIFVIQSVLLNLLWPFHYPHSLQ